MASKATFNLHTPARQNCKSQKQQRVFHAFVDVTDSGTAAPQPWLTNNEKPGRRGLEPPGGTPRMAQKSPRNLPNQYPIPRRMHVLS
tara:strand:- start:1534 stop:1794 length:261 start_codon:yes stop_codon:yes gene_type:complete